MEFVSFLTMQMHGTYLVQELIQNEIFLSKKVMRKTMGAKTQGRAGKGEEGGKNYYWVTVC